jgi:hypothetical protein
VVDQDAASPSAPTEPATCREFLLLLGGASITALFLGSIMFWI